MLNWQCLRFNLFCFFSSKEETFAPIEWARGVKNFRPQTTAQCSSCLLDKSLQLIVNTFHFAPFFSSLFQRRHVNSTQSVSCPKIHSVQEAHAGLLCAPLSFKRRHQKRRLWHQMGRRLTTRWSSVWWCRTLWWPQTEKPLHFHLEKRRSRLRKVRRIQNVDR